MEQNPVIISQSKEAEADYNVIKILALAAAEVFFGLCAVYFFNSFVAQVDYHYLLWASFFSLFFFALMTLNTFLVKSLYKLQGIVFIVTLLPLLIFYNRLFPVPSYPLIGGAVLFAIVMGVGIRHGARTLQNSLKVRFFEVARVVLPKVVTGFLIFLSVLVYANYFEWGNFNPALGQKIVDETLHSGEPLARFLIPDISFDKPLKEVLDAFTERELQKSDIVAQNDAQISFSKLTGDAKAKAIAEVSGRLRASLEKSFGELNVNEPVNSIVYGLIKKYIDTLGPLGQSIFGIGTIILVFFLLKGVVILFYWLINFVAFLIFKFLLAIKFAHISVETRSRDFISLS